MPPTPKSLVPVSRASPQGSSPPNAHQLFVTLAGEMIGVAILAIIADMSEDGGKIVVAIMGGWFLLFLMIQAQFLSGLAGKL